MTRWLGDMTEAELERISAKNRASHIRPSQAFSQPVSKGGRAPRDKAQLAQTRIRAATLESILLDPEIAKPSQKARQRNPGESSVIPNGKLKPRYEQMLAQQVIEAKLPPAISEYYFDALRQWRIDLAWPLRGKLAVEIDSSVHRINARFQADMEKHQALFFAGWRLLRVSTKQVRNGEAVELIRRALA